MSGCYESKARTFEEVRAYVEKLLPMQRGDFTAIFLGMAGRPVTIRLLDPPLHEFVPHGVRLCVRAT